MSEICHSITAYGLQVREDGCITLNGKPYYGMGVNYYTAFCLALDVEFFDDTHTDLEAHFRALSENHIPFIRTMMGVYYGNDVTLYADEQNRPRYFAAMDRLVALAEAYHIGIVASLFWNINAFGDYCGEPLDANERPDSKTMQLRYRYIRDVVERYRSSPAIWAWEVGNELNLAVDLLRTRFVGMEGEERLFDTSLLTNYYRLVGEEIRRLDPHRMITGGDAAPRTASMALFRTKGEQEYPDNTYEENKMVFSWYTPFPLNTISLHYPELPLMEDYVKIAKELRIGLYVGEYHGTLFENYGDLLSAEESQEEALEQKTWKNMVDTYCRLGVQITTAWTYGTYSQGRRKDAASLELGILDGFAQNLYQRDYLLKINREYEQCGKSDAEAYWANSDVSIP